MDLVTLEGFNGGVTGLTVTQRNILRQAQEALAVYVRAFPENYDKTFETALVINECIKNDRLHEEDVRTLRWQLYGYEQWAAMRVQTLKQIIGDEAREEEALVSQAHRALATVRQIFTREYGEAPASSAILYAVLGGVLLWWLS